MRRINMKPEGSRGALSLRGLVLKYIPTVVAFAALARLAGHLVARKEVPAYEANASVLFRFGIEYTPVNPAFDSWRGDPVRLFNNDAILTELQILSSRRVLERTLERLKPTHADLPGLQEVTNRLSVRRIEGTNVARIRYRSEDPELALALVGQVLSDYLEIRTEPFRQESFQASSTYANQAREDWIYALKQLQQFQRVIDASGSSADLSDDMSAQLSILQAASESARRRFDAATQLAERCDLSEQLDMAMGPNIEVLEDAALIPDPVGLTIGASAALAAAIGAAFGAFISALLEWRRMTKSPVSRV
ncbi:MAG: hypothetical protein C0524_04365 [Rhodobacter sp.]|nr:hypothetical protein [Rhodobacter sp.]